MNWLAVKDCEAASNFGWLVGVYSGLFVDTAAALMYVSAHAFLMGAHRFIGRRRRRIFQSLLRTLPWLLVVVWTVCATRAGAPLFHCYAIWLVLGASAPMVLALLLLMNTAANRVGSKGVRS